MVVITPEGLTFRRRYEPMSAKTTSPEGETAMPTGRSICAIVACPPSPANPATPVPAKVEMMPAGVTLRTRWLSVSVM